MSGGLTAVQPTNAICIMDSFDVDQATVTQGYFYQSNLPYDLPIENSALTVGGQLTITGKVTINHTNDGFTARWIPWWLDTIKFNEPQFNASDLPASVDASSAPAAAIIAPMPTMANPVNLVPVTAALSNYEHKSNQGGYLIGCENYSVGTQLRNLNALNSIAVCAQNNSFGINNLVNPSASYSFFSLQNLGAPTSFFPLLPNFRQQIVYDTIYQLVNINPHCCEESTWWNSYGANLDGVTSTGTAPVDWCFGMGWNRGDVVTTWNDTNPLAFNTATEQFLDLESLSYTNPKTAANSMVAHQLGFLRDLCYVADDFYSSESTIHSPYMFPINNSRWSSKNPCYTNPSSSHRPEIYNVFLPINNRLTNLHHEGFPVPMHQIIWNAPNGLLSMNTDAPASVMNANETAVYMTNRDQSNFCYGAVNHTEVNLVSLPRLYIPPPPDFLLMAGQARNGNCEWPVSLPAEFFTQQLYQYRGNYWGAQQDAIHMTYHPHGYTSQRKFIFSGRKLFAFTSTEESPQDYTTLVQFESKIKIPWGTYSQAELLLAIQEAISLKDTDGSSPFARIIDPSSTPMMFVATDEEGDETPWSTPFNPPTVTNPNPSPDLNMCGPSRNGHKGRGVHIVSGPNTKIEAGSNLFSIGASPDAGYIQVTGVEVPFYVDDLLSTTTLTADQSSICATYASYQVAMGDPPCVGNYGYTQQVAGSTISVQSTPVDPAFVQRAITLAPFDLTTVSNAALQFPSPACYDLPAEGVSFVRHPVKYGNSVSNSILTVHGSGLVYNVDSQDNRLSGPVQLTDPLHYLPISLRSQTVLNPWIKANMSGSHGLVLKSLSNKSEHDRNFWKLLGFLPDKVEDLFEEKLQYHQPVQGWYYNSRDDDDVGYYFTPSAFPISDQTPWLNHQYCPIFLRCLPQETPGEAIDQTIANYIEALPYYRCTMNKNVTMVTNHPLFCTVQAAGLRASGSPFVSLPMDVTYGLNEATAWPGSFTPIPSNAFSLVYQRNGLYNGLPRAFLASDMIRVVTVPGINGDSGSVINVSPRLTDYVGLNPYLMHNIMQVSSGGSIEADISNTGLYFQTSMSAPNGGFLTPAGAPPGYVLSAVGTNAYVQLKKVGLVSTNDMDEAAASSPALIPGTFWFATANSYEVTPRPTGSVVASAMTFGKTKYPANLNYYGSIAGGPMITGGLAVTTMMLANMSVVPIFNNPSATELDPAPPVFSSTIQRMAPAGLDVFARGMSTVDQMCFVSNNNATGWSAYADDTDWYYYYGNTLAQPDWNIPIATPYCTPVTTRVDASDISFSKFLTDFMQPHTTGRIPRAGMIDCSSVAPWAINVDPATIAHGYRGFAIAAQLFKTVSGPYVNGITPHEYNANIYNKIGKESRTVGMVVNFNSRKALCSVFATGSNYSASNGGILPSIGTWKTSVQPLDPNSGIDYSEPIQLPPAQQNLPAFTNMQLFGTLGNQGVILLQIEGLTLSTPSLTMVNGKPIWNALRCTIAPTNSDALQFVVFNTDAVLQIPKQTLLFLKYRLFTMTGENIDNVSSVRVFSTFTPLNAPTAVEQAFAQQEALPNANQATAPTLTSLGPNVVGVQPQPVSVSRSDMKEMGDQTAKRKRYNDFRGLSAGPTGAPRTVFQ